MAEGLQARVGARIAEARLASGLTQRQLARELGGATRTVQTWEGGNFLPRAQTLERIAKVTGRPVSWFYEADDERVPA